MTVGGKTNPGAHRDSRYSCAAPPRPNRLPFQKMILLSMILSTLSLSPALMTPLQGERFGSHRQPLQRVQNKICKITLVPEKCDAYLWIFRVF
jgi:hypothetical protein